MIVPKIGDIYHVERIESRHLEKRDDIIMIVSRDQDRHPEEDTVWFYGESIRDKSEWSQYLADFEGFINKTNNDYHFTKISKEENPEYWL